MKLKAPWISRKRARGKGQRDSLSTDKVTAASAAPKAAVEVAAIKTSRTTVGQTGQRAPLVVVEQPKTPIALVVDEEDHASFYGSFILPYKPPTWPTRNQEGSKNLIKLAEYVLFSSTSDDDHSIPNGTSSLATGTTVSLLSTSTNAVPLPSVDSTATPIGQKICDKREVPHCPEPSSDLKLEETLPEGMPREITFRSIQDHRSRHERAVSVESFCGVFRSVVSFFFTDQADPDDFFLRVRFPVLPEENLFQMAKIGKRIYMKHSGEGRRPSLTLVPSDVFVEVAAYQTVPAVSSALENMLQAHFSASAPRDASLILQARVILFQDGTSFKDLFCGEAIPDRMELAVAWSLSTKLDGRVCEGGMEVEIINTDQAEEMKSMEHSILSKAATKIADRIRNAGNGITMLLGI